MKTMVGSCLKFKGVRFANSPLSQQISNPIKLFLGPLLPQKHDCVEHFGLQQRDELTFPRTRILLSAYILGRIQAKIFQYNLNYYYYYCFSSCLTLRPSLRLQRLSHGPEIVDYWFYHGICRGIGAIQWIHVGGGTLKCFHHSIEKAFCQPQFICAHSHSYQTYHLRLQMSCILI